MTFPVPKAGNIFFLFTGFSSPIMDSGSRVGLFLQLIISTISGKFATNEWVIFVVLQLPMKREIISRISYYFYFSRSLKQPNDAE